VADAEETDSDRASNREDLIDPTTIPAAGRLDVKIKIERPDEGAAARSSPKYLNSRLPLDESEVLSLGGATATRRSRP